MRIFGKDGIKGIAVTEVTAELSLQVGRAIANIIAKRKKDKRVKIVIGKDTRVSSDVLENAFAAGASSSGADVIKLGVCPVPALSYFVKKLEADCGVMISASHLSAEYNGIRLYSSDGYRSLEGDEEKIEKFIIDTPEKLRVYSGERIGNIINYENAQTEYIDHIVNSVDSKTFFNGIKIALDLANGATAFTAKKIFERLGADVIAINDSPDGNNINKNCGSTHMREILELVPREKCDIGFAFDGDGDRCMAVDENGDIIDGDGIIAILSKAMKDSGKLKNNTIVVTSSSNLGLFHFARKNNINVEQTGPQETYIIERMLEKEVNIGGNQAGIIILSDYSTTGDGELAAAKVVEVMKNSALKASDLGKYIVKFPQVMLNVKILPKDREIWKNDYVITGLIEKYEEILGDDGRILVRESSSDSLIRIMAEGKDFKQINKIAMKIADTIKSRVGKNKGARKF